MFFNIYNWLAAPSLGGGVLGGYVAPPDPKPQRLQCPELSTTGKVPGTAYKALIGAHSAYSDGSGSVAEWASAAKAKGYSILVFAENLALMSEAKWNREKADCAAVTDSTFKAVAGIDYMDNMRSADSVGTHRITYDLQRWFDPAWLSPDGKKVCNNGSVMFGNNYPGTILTNCATNPMPAWYNKFYQAFSIYTYNHNTLEEPAWKEYLQLIRDCYLERPHAVHRLYSPSEFAGVSGFDVYVKGTSLDTAYTNLKPYAWNAPRHGCIQASYISEGPRIIDWYIENGWFAPTDCGGVAGNQWTLHINVSAEAGISEVMIYDGLDVFRRFKPSGRSFETTVKGLHDKQHGFVMIVTDRHGKKAVSAGLNTSSREAVMDMCEDEQNTQSFVNAPDATNTRMLAFGSYGSADTGCDGGFLVRMGFTTADMARLLASIWLSMVFNTKLLID